VHDAVPVAAQGDLVDQLRRRRRDHVDAVDAVAGIAVAAVGEADRHQLLAGVGAEVDDALDQVQVVAGGGPVDAFAARQRAAVPVGTGQRRGARTAALVDERRVERTAAVADVEQHRSRRLQADRQRIRQRGRLRPGLVRIRQPARPDTAVVVVGGWVECPVAAVDGVAVGAPCRARQAS